MHPPSYSSTGPTPPPLDHPSDNQPQVLKLWGLLFRPAWLEPCSRVDCSSAPLPEAPPFFFFRPVRSSYSLRVHAPAVQSKHDGGGLIARHPKGGPRPMGSHPNLGGGCVIYFLNPTTLQIVFTCCTKDLGLRNPLNL